MESQLSILTEKDVDPFIELDINDGDIFEATPDFLTIDSDREDDEDIPVSTRRRFDVHTTPITLIDKILQDIL